jgi:hypothetical protein
VGDFISERWAISNRNGGRFHFGIVGDFGRNQQGKADNAKGDVHNTAGDVKDAARDAADAMKK